MTETVEAIPIELTFYCMRKEPCDRQYACIVRGWLNACPSLVAKSDRKIFDEIRAEREAIKEEAGK